MTPSGSPDMAEYQPRGRSGIYTIYVTVSVASLLLIWVASGSLSVALSVCGWVGLLTAVAVNELTPGYTMRGGQR